jgi:predicted N-acetyltransferase YhbS
MNIRKALSSDIAILEEMQKELYVDDFDKYRPNLEKIIFEELVLVCVIDNKIIGYQLCEFFNSDNKNFPDSIFISGLYVDKNYRKQGIGSSLIREALNTSWPSKYKYFSLTHDPDEKHLSSFYNKFGFNECGFTEAGNVKMIREL